MIIYLGQALLTLLGVGLLAFAGDQPVLQSIGAGLVGSGLTYYIYELVQHPKQCLLAVWGAFHAPAEVYVSAAALVRICVDGKLVLMWDEKKSQYQPVGGALKRFPGVRPPFPHWNAKHAEDCDLRIWVRAWRLPHVYGWFATSKDRESSPWREFYDELIRPDILPTAVAPSVSMRFLRRSIELPQRRPAYEHKFVTRFFEIHEAILNDSQANAIRTALATESADGLPTIIAVDATEVRRGFVDRPRGEKGRVHIGDHTHLILEA